MRPLLALALSGFKEAVRNRVTVVVAAFALVLIGLTTVVMNLTIFSLDRVVVDFGLGVMSLLLLGLTIFMSVAMLNRELERKTVFLLVSRPISRSAFLVSRFAGMVATLTVLQAAMALVFLLQLVMFDVPLTSTIPAALVGVWCQCLVLCALGVFFSSVAGQVTAAVSAIGLYLVGQWTGDLFVLAVHVPPALRTVMHLGYYVLPNFARMDFKASAAAGLAVSAGDLLGAVGAALGWTLVLLAGSTVAFAKRDFK